MTLREWLNQGAALLNDGPHSDRARRDAETLLLHHIGKNKAWLIAHDEEDFAGCAAIGYAALVERRRRGEPIQYITGECEFYGLPFRVTPDVLIPRPETEHLVEKALSLVKQVNAPSLDPETWESTSASPALRILDVGTGSGAIAIALASRLRSADITAIDISQSALAVARDNATRNEVIAHIRFLQGDLLAPVAGEQFEIIVSNPPYVPNTDRALIAVEVREHEPHVALFGGHDGLDIYRRLIPAAYDALVPGGYLAFEFGFSQMTDIELLLQNAGFQNIEFVHDLQGIPRVAAAQRP
jgi:release factor glutamine methyltransferase